MGVAQRDIFVNKRRHAVEMNYKNRPIFLLPCDFNTNVTARNESGV